MPTIKEIASPSAQRSCASLQDDFKTASFESTSQRFEVGLRRPKTLDEMLRMSSDYHGDHSSLRVEPSRPVALVCRSSRFVVGLHTTQLSFTRPKADQSDDTTLCAGSTTTSPTERHHTITDLSMKIHRVRPVAAFRLIPPLLYGTQRPVTCT